MCEGPGTGGGKASRTRLRETTQEYIYNTLRGFHISARHGCGRTRIHYSPGRRNDANGPHEPRSTRNVILEEAANYVKPGEICDRLDGIHAALLLRIRASEVNGEDADVGRAPSPASAIKCNRHCKFDRLLADAIIVQKILRSVGPRRHALQKLPHHFFGIIQQLARCLMRALQAVAGTDFAQTFSSGVASCNLRAAIAFTLVRRAYVVEQ